MKTHNLQEMIKADDGGLIFNDAKNPFIDHHEEGDNGFSLPPFDVPASNPGADLERIESPIQPSPETELIPQESTTEADLIAYTKFLHARAAISTVQCYWLIGKSILSFYQGKYGTGELQKISEATGIGRDTLTKACKFARQYTEDQVKEILRGKFVLSWFELAQSLSVAPMNLIAAYQASSSPLEFHNAIIKLKPRNQRNRQKPPAPKKAKGISSAVSTQNPIRGEIQDGLQEVEKVADIPIDHVISSDKEKSSLLEAEVSDLRGTVTEKDQQIADLQNLLDKKDQQIGVLEEAVDSLRRFLGKVRLNLEIKTPHASLYKMVSDEEWVYEKKLGYLKASILEKN
jgi:hypothetical protein